MKLLKVLVLASVLCVCVKADVFSDIADDIRRAIGKVDDAKKWFDKTKEDLDDLPKKIRYAAYFTKKLLEWQDEIRDLVDQINLQRVNPNGVCDLTEIRMKAKVLIDSLDTFETVTPVMGTANFNGYVVPGCYGPPFLPGDAIALADCWTDSKTCTVGKYYTVDPIVGTEIPIYAYCGNATYGIYNGSPTELFAFDIQFFTDSACADRLWPVVDHIHVVEIQISATGRQTNVCTNVSTTLIPEMKSYAGDFTPGGASAFASPSRLICSLLAFVAFALSFAL